MNLSSRLTFALVTVVLVVVFGHVTYSVYLDYRTTRTQAGTAIAQGAQPELTESLQNTRALTSAVAAALKADPKLAQAIDNKDKAALPSIVKAQCDHFIFPGSVWVLDDKGVVLYSSDTPKQSGYSMKQDSWGMEVVVNSKNEFRGVAVNNKTGFISVSTIIPVSHGILAVNQPIDQDYLSAVATRMGIDNPNAQGVELAAYSVKQGKAVAWSRSFTELPCSKFLIGLKLPPDFPKTGFPAITGIQFIDQLIVPVPGFERNNGWWNYTPLVDKDLPNVLGVIFLVKPVPDMQSKAIAVFLMGGLVGVLGILVGVFLATRIASQVNEPMRFLIKRTRAIASNKQVIPPLEGLSGDWYELGELIDTAVLSMRSTTQNLKTQLTKQMKQVEERNQIAEQSTQQLDVLNNQITHQAKQIAEINRQINQSNRQAILVQQQLDAILQTSTEGFLVLDQYGNILLANLVFLNWLGASEGEVAGRLCFDLVRKPGEEANSGTGQAFAQHGGDPHALINQFYPEGVVYHKNGQKKVEVLAHLQPLTGDDATINGYIMVLRDRTLRSENQLLRQEIVSMLQDNIRAPLTSAEASWSAILSNSKNTMHPAVGQSLSEIHSHYEQLIGLVDSLLMMYGGFVPPPAPPKEQVAISRVVADCLEEITPLAREHQLSLDYKTVTGLPPISGNRDVVMSILRQVLERMVTITAPGGRVRVESQMRGNEMRIGVASSGPALPESEIADMFVGFIEGKHSQESYGARLSMYLARSNVERLGGKIWAESEAGRGTATYFTLPVG